MEDTILVFWPRCLHRRQIEMIVLIKFTSIYIPSFYSLQHWSGSAKLNVLSLPVLFYFWKDRVAPQAPRMVSSGVSSQSKSRMLLCHQWAPRWKYNCKQYQWWVCMMSEISDFAHRRKSQWSYRPEHDIKRLTAVFMALYSCFRITSFLSTRAQSRDLKSFKNTFNHLIRLIITGYLFRRCWWAFAWPLN